MKTKLIDLTTVSASAIHKFAITGGPCGGKSTAMARLREHFEDRGYAVLIVPEAATILFSAGVVIGADGVTNEVFQEMVLKQSIVQEQIAFQAALEYQKHSKKVVILCDRGFLDGRAYVPHEAFATIVASLGYDLADLSERQYHGVYHLQSVAVGLPHLFSSATNAARKENQKQAAELDHQTYLAWHHHPHHRVIDNSTDFDTKINRLIAEIANQVGDPKSIERERKFRVRQIQIEQIPVPYHVALIRQWYLKSANPQEVRRVRMRTGELGVSYYYTKKEKLGSGESIETERIVDRAEFETLLSDRDNSRAEIVKRRASFHWNGGFFEMDYFLEPTENVLTQNGECLLEVERVDSGRSGSPINLPDFLQNLGEVTADPAYGNYSLSLKN